MVPIRNVPGGRDLAPRLLPAVRVTGGHTSRLSNGGVGGLSYRQVMSTPTVPTGVAPIDPAERVGTRVDGIEVLGALSPSRAGDFLACPLLYRFRTIDRLPEPPSVDAVRGTVVHKVLEDLFDLPAPERVPDRAADMVVPAWEAVLEAEPALATLFPDNDEGAAIGAWLASCRSVLARYFSLEDPRRLEPADRELYVETLTDTKLLLRGVIDRVDVAPDGAIRLVDYKSGRSPSVEFERQGAVPAQVLRAGHLADAGRDPEAAPADLPRQRRDAELRPRRAGPARHRAQGAGGLGGRPAREGDG